MVLDDLPMWGMLGETLRDPNTGKMTKVGRIPFSFLIYFNYFLIIFFLLM